MESLWLSVSAAQFQACWAHNSLQIDKHRDEVYLATVVRVLVA